MAYEGIEVSGGSVLALLNGFGEFTAVANRILLEVGLGVEGPDKRVQLSAEAWYPAEKMARAMEKIQAQVGKNTLYQVGFSIPRTALRASATVPTSVAGAIHNLDVSYHLNFRKNGVPMANPGTGEVQEGIGHYRYEQLEGQNLALCVVTTPYPCDFDRGLLTALVQRVQPSAMTSHEPGKPCKKKGGQSCTFRISWL